MNPQQTERKQYTARARPLLEGHGYYRRGGQTFGAEPITLTVLPLGVAPKEPGEVTPEQFALIEADANVTLREVSAAAQAQKTSKEPGDPAAKQASAAAAATKAQDDEQKRLDDLAKDAEKHNVKGR
jgi:hypothetical protein